MTKIAVSGGTGYAGRFVVDNLLAAGHQVLMLGRRKPPRDLYLGQTEFCYYKLSDEHIDPSLFSDCDALVHAAFHHKKGKYRGGEGDDPEGFRRLNHLGSIEIFKAARSAGVKRVVFLSSRAVYGSQNPGEWLNEETQPDPDSLYGQIKLETEQSLLELEHDKFLPIIVRATGIYGASEGSRQHKWASLFKAFENGEAIDARIGTEVHGTDFAQAVSLLLTLERGRLCQKRIFNVSDILLDRYELLQSYAKLRGMIAKKLPPKSDSSSYNQMDCSRLKNLGWKPRGALDLGKIVAPPL